MADPKPAAVEPQPKTPPQSDAPQSDDATPPAPPKTYAQEEVDRIVQKVRRNAARDAELRLRRQGTPAATPQPKDEPPPPPKDEEPKRDQFDTHEDYQRALTRYDAGKATDERLAKEKEAEREKAHRESQQQAETAWKGKIERAMAKHADFEDVLEEAPEGLLNDIYGSKMRPAIIESDIGPEIVLHLVKNPDEVKRIAALPGYKQAAEIVKLEEKLAPAAPPKPKDPPEDDDETPEAKEARERRERDAGGRFKKDPPEPIEPGSGRPANNSTAPSDKDDAETWRRKELARMRKAQGK